MNTHYEIGPFRFDARTLTLTRADVVEPIGTRAAAVLAVLVEHANEPVLKSAIIDAAWPGLVVEECNLSVQISKIRRVLGKAPDGNRWIETLARRGYRFVG
ncbi:MAG TPA: winged helix-turn-helix domain-containing protein, partial [Casimicrobiaceae bacterium]|nr:winged helix-turn-helix domain-containing protein [Casimicrobiaceae bacterium]